MKNTMMNVMFQRTVIPQENPHITVPHGYSTDDVLKNLVGHSPSPSANSYAYASQPPAAEKISSGFSGRTIGVYACLFFLPILGSLGFRYALANSSEEQTLMSPTSQVRTQTSSAGQTYEETLTEETHSPKDVEYELSLAQGFLRKAVELSNQPGEQTTEQKSKIVSLLNQAVLASTRAIEIAPEDYRGYKIRGKIYQTTASIKPEVQSLADTDLARASQLELAQAQQQSLPSEHPLEYVETKQAQAAPQAMIASPDQNQSSTVTTTQESNVNKGTTTLGKGVKEIFVPFAAVKDTTQLYVQAEQNPENLIFYVKTKEEGKGFTVASTSAPTQSTEISWWEIE